MKFQFRAKLPLNNGKTLELNNIVELKYNNTEFEHTVLLGETVLAIRRGRFDKNLSFDEFFTWRAKRAKVHAAQKLKEAL